MKKNPNPFTLLIIAQIIVTCLWTTGIAQAKDGLSIYEAINISGHQRMLTQRIIKTYAQSGLGIQSEAADNQRKKALDLFERQLDKLLNQAALTPRIRGTLARIALQWQPFKRIANSKPNSHSGEALYHSGEELLFASHRLVQLLQDHANSSKGRLINLSGRQRMLSQRMAMLSMMRAWGFRSLSINNELARAKLEFSAAHEMLKFAPENTEAIAVELNHISTQWDWFQKALSLDSDEAYQLIVAESSESILDSMDKLTRLYEKLAS